MLLLMSLPLCTVHWYIVILNIVPVCGPPVRFQIQRLLGQYREQLLVIFLIIRKLNTTNDALCFNCTHYLTDARLQIFLYVFKCIKGYYDVAWHNNIEVISNSSLRSGDAGRVLRMKIVRTECFKRSYFNKIVPMWNALPRQLREAISSNTKHLYNTCTTSAQIFRVCWDDLLYPLSVSFT